MALKNSELRCGGCFYPTPLLTIPTHTTWEQPVTYGVLRPLRPHVSHA